VRLIGIDGNQEGVVPLAVAKKAAEKAREQVDEIVDLVQVI